MSSIINHANKTINNSLTHPCPDPFSYIKNENLSLKVENIDKINSKLIEEIKKFKNSKRQHFIKNVINQKEICLHMELKYLISYKISF